MCILFFEDVLENYDIANCELLAIGLWYVLFEESEVGSAHGGMDKITGSWVDPEQILPKAAKM